MNFLMIAIFFQWQLWKYEAEHQERVVRLSLPGPAPHIQVISPCLTINSHRWFPRSSQQVAKIMRKEGRDALVGAEPEAVSSSGLIMEARWQK